MSNSKYYKRTHPFTILTRFKSSVVLLLIPIIQQILFKPQGIFETISTMGINALYATGVIFYAVASYRCYKYRVLPKGINIRNGFFVKRSFIVPFHKIQTVNFHKNIFASMFGAVKVSFDTPAGLSKFYDISAFFSKKQAKNIFQKLQQDNKPGYIYRSGNMSMLLMSAFWSNPATGLLFAAPFVSRAGDIVSSEIKDVLYNSMNFFWENIALGISPAAATVANVLVFGWTVAVLVQFFRYGRFSAYRQGEYVVISRGIINKNVSFTRADRIAAVTINQSLFMRLLKLYSSGIFTIGSGKLKGDKSLIIAAEKKNKLYHSLKNIVRFSAKETESIYTGKNTLISYICVPIWITFFVTALIVIADYFSVINELFKILMIFALIPLLWWVAFRVFAHKYAHLGVNGKYLIACGYNIWTLKKYLIPFDKIQYISVKQSIFQKRKGTCDIKVYLYFEKRACQTIKHLPKPEAEKLIDNIQYKIK